MKAPLECLERCPDFQTAHLQGSDFIGSYTLPVSSMVSGYRHVHLTNAGNKLPNASVFLHMQMHDLVQGSIQCGGSSPPLPQTLQLLPQTFKLSPLVACMLAPGRMPLDPPTLLMSHLPPQTKNPR